MCPSTWAPPNTKSARRLTPLADAIIAKNAKEEEEMINLSTELGMQKAMLAMLRSQQETQREMLRKIQTDETPIIIVYH